MDQNHDSEWPEANSAVVSPLWSLAGSGNDNASPPNLSGLGLESVATPLQSLPTPEPVACRVQDAAATNRHVYLFVLGMGLILALLAVVISTRVLPRYLDVQRRYGFELPRETTLVLHSGMIQPIPGCAVILAGLTGLLARRPSRRHALVTAILLLAALAVPLATATALLLPELTLV